MKRGKTGKIPYRKRAAAAIACLLAAALLCPAFADETEIDINEGGSMTLDNVADDGPQLPAENTYSPGESVISRYFTPQESATGQKLESARRDKANAERGLSDAEDALEDLHSESEDIQTYLIQVDQRLQEANQKLLEFDELVSEKERSIEEADAKVREAREDQIRRKENMKGRIKYMYEQGSESYMDILLSSSSFSDFLNKSNYFESINRYDRKMLKEYARIESEISVQEEELKGQRETLELLRGETEQGVATVYQEIIEASESLKEYTDQIAEKEAMALAYEQEIAEKENDIATLQEQYKKELAISMDAAAIGFRDLSDIIFGNGDLDLMAAMIECEAGGESYTGKVAVGAVILNRVRSPKFPNTVLEVLMQNRQFSPVASGRFSMVLARGANASCYQAAADAMAGASPVGGCLFFRTPIPGLVGQQIGGHVFY